MKFGRTGPNESREMTFQPRAARWTTDIGKKSLTLESREDGLETQTDQEGTHNLRRRQGHRAGER